MSAHRLWWSGLCASVALAIAVFIVGTHNGRTEDWAFLTCVVLGQVAALCTGGWWGTRS